MNQGLSKAVIDLLDKKTDMWFKDMLPELQKQFPDLNMCQLSGTLTSLKRYGKVIHLCRGAWAHTEYPYR